jgi:hypothetical protein
MEKTENKECFPLFHSTCPCYDESYESVSRFRSQITHYKAGSAYLKDNEFHCLP